MRAHRGPIPAPGGPRSGSSTVVISLAERERARERPPKPELRLNLLGTLAATSLALLAYLAALLAHLSLPQTFAGVLFAVAPACAIPATVLLAVRARAEQDEALARRDGGSGHRLRRDGPAADRLSAAISPGGGVFAHVVRRQRAAHPAGISRCPPARSPRRSAGRAACGGASGWSSASSMAFALRHGGARLVDARARRRLATRSACVLAMLCGRSSSRRSRHPLDPAQRSASHGHPRLDHDRDGAVGLRRGAECARPSALQRHLVGEPRHPRGDVRGAARRPASCSTATQLQRLERYSTTELARAEGEVSSWAEVTERLLAATSALSAAVTADDVAVLLTAAGAGAIEVDDAVIYLRRPRGPAALPHDRRAPRRGRSGSGSRPSRDRRTPTCCCTAQPGFPGERRADSRGLPGGTGACRRTASPVRWRRFR